MIQDLLLFHLQKMNLMMNNQFQDKNIVERDELVELLLDTAIEYLENKLK